MDRPHIRAALESIVVFLVGVAPGFFVAFNVVFADGGADEKVLALLYVLGAYLLLGGVVGLLTRSADRLQGLALGGAALLILAWYSTKEPQNVAYHLFVLLAALAGGYIGILVGRRFQRPHRLGRVEPETSGPKS